MEIVKNIKLTNKCLIMVAFILDIHMDIDFIHSFRRRACSLSVSKQVFG